ncbi:hypothetical protein MKEN_01216000 [Mycena kentingensis (nom. inval.)]|nr:hypothetical protein MKEN_01216000 [Mycena kentingensis (nom. inval.)]
MPSSDGAKPSFPFYLAVDAAQIVANNAAGYLTSADAPEDRISSDDPAAQLPAGSYLFYTLDYAQNQKYSLCGSFRAWSPPLSLPDRWNLPFDPSPAISKSVLSFTARSADKRCMMTAEISRLQVAHLVPQAESCWWDFRSMDAIIRTAAGVNQLANVVTLRADLTEMGMDAGHFVFAPYNDHIVAVFLTTSQSDLAHQFHMRRVALPKRIHRHALYCRFAYNIFESNKIDLPHFSRLQDVSEVKVLADLSAPLEEIKKRKRSGVKEQVPSLSMSTAGSSSNADSAGSVSEEDAEISSPVQNLPDLFPHFTTKDYDLWAAQEAEATRLGSFSDDVYPGFAAIMRLKSEHLKHRQPGGAAIGGIWDGWDLSQFAP